VRACAPPILLPWLLCKLSAGEVCCMLKPFAIRALMSAGFDTIVSLDTDLYFFSDAAPFWSAVWPIGRAAH
jgi:hypothetical protein